jgi:hypothetical protein
MSLIYALVARGNTILAEFTDSSGNFTTVSSGPSLSPSAVRGSVWRVCVCVKVVCVCTSIHMCNPSALSTARQQMARDVFARACCSFGATHLCTCV